MIVRPLNRRIAERLAVVILAALLTSTVLACGSTEPGSGRSPTGSTGSEEPKSDTTSSEIPPGDEAREGEGQEDARQAAPWQRERLETDDVPDVFREQWMQADNRDSCALVAPADLGEGEGADVRSAHFGGGWGIAYDMPELRSAFGIAGTGAEANSHTYDEWPFKVEWKDGSTAGYGPEGGSGPNQLAYLRIQGQDCLYNVWSRLGVRHLRSLIENLRFVETGH